MISNQNRRILGLVLLSILFICLFTSCVPEDYTFEKYGFWSGIWHGICFPITLIGKIFGSGYGLYAEHNTGFTYWLGYIIGIGGLGGGGMAAR
jgi:hypothetical protein